MIWLIGSGPSSSRRGNDGCRTSICTFTVIEDTISYALCLISVRTCPNTTTSLIILGPGSTSGRRRRIVHLGVIMFNPQYHLVSCCCEAMAH